MEPLFRDGDDIVAAVGWHACHDPKRDEVVLVRFSGNTQPLLKRIRAVPGDIFSVHSVGEESGELWVSGKRLKNSAGQSYRFTLSRTEIWRSYERRFSGVVPKGSYFVMGERPEGSLDSSRFGFIAVEDLMAKVLARE